MKNIFILIKREVQQLFSFKTLAAGHIIQPIAWLILFSSGMASIVQPFQYRGIVVTYLDFIVPGLLALQAFAQFGYCLSRVANEKRHGMFQNILSSGVTSSQYILGKIGISLLIVLVQAAFILLTYYFIFNGTNLGLERIIKSVPFLILGTIAWSSLGIAGGTVFCSAERSSLATSLLGLPIMFSSSVFYKVETMAPFLRGLSYVNPLTYLAATLRNLYLNEVIYINDAFILIFLTLICFGISIYAVNTTELVTFEK